MRTTFAKEDFLDLSYNDTWASEMGLIKVSTGKRQDDEILPASKDTTIDVPGSDGVYYLNSKFQQKEFTINFAYDGLKERDILAIREWLAPKKECQLIFSERPYKYYMAKPKSAPKLSYIAFDDTDGTRVYRGEGTVQFVCYYPWARSISRFKKDLIDMGATEQQLAESGLLSEEKRAAEIFLAGALPCNNYGQMPTPFKFFFEVNPDATTVTGNYAAISISQNGDVLGQLWLDRTANWATGKTYLLDSESHLILSVKNVKYENNKLTYDIEESNGNAIIMNGAIVAGDFFNLPVGESIFTVDSSGFFTPRNGYFLYDYLYY